jgi:hypothetical protein
MSHKPQIDPLPERERQEMLDLFLDVLDRHPSLKHFRSVVRTRADRQLALIAAFERDVLVGNPAACPPAHDDEADQLLCDILDCTDEHPELKIQGCSYGSDRHLVNLQALGLWHATTPLNQPTAHELFAALFSTLNTAPLSTLPSSNSNNSPAPQVLSPNGELIGLPTSSQAESADSQLSSQPVDGVLVVAITPSNQLATDAPQQHGIIRHAAQTPGEKSASQLSCSPLSDSQALAPSPSPSDIPARPVRRGRPIKLDDLAKGRLLGLMSYGLSFRQAAAQLGVHHQTLFNALKRDEEFAQQVSEARLDAISQPLLTVVQASRTSWRAAAWLTKFLEDRRASTYETTPEERALQKH